VQNEVIDQRIGNLLVATVALSMVMSPFLFMINERLVQPRFSSQLPDREPDEIDEKENPVILAGFGRFGHIVGRVLNLQAIKTTVLDLDAEQVELVRGSQRFSTATPRGSKCCRPPVYRRISDYCHL
jgi:hypothetical protein